VNGIEIELRLFGQVGAVMPGVRPTPGLGSYRHANVRKLAEYKVRGIIPGPGAAAASSKVNGVESSTDAAVGWVKVNALIVPATATRAVPT
jgi:hypothetical protein